MKKLLLFLVLLFAAVSLPAQTTSTARRFVNFGSAPANCGPGAVYYNSASQTTFFCNNSGTWVSFGGGAVVTSITGDGVIVTNSGSTGAVTLTVDTQTGTGSIVLANTPTLITPVLGAATGTSLNLGGTGVLSTTAQSGTGSLCMTTNCAMTTPNLGTPSAVTLTNGTGYLLNNVAAATGTATIANGNNPITWNWAQTTDSQTGFTLGETSAATNGTITSSVANQSEVKISTAGNSTAAPLTVSQGALTGTNAYPALQVLPSWNNASLTGIGLLVKVTDTASGAGSNIAQFMDGASNVYTFGKSGVISMTGGGQTGQFSQAGNSFFFNNSNGTIQLPISSGSLTISDGSAAAGKFGSTMFIGDTACETNFAPTTLSTGATTTDTGLNCLPANSFIDAVVARVTTTITAACTGWELGDATTATRFSTNNTTLTSGTTTDAAHIGTFNNTGIASATTGVWQAAAAKVRITCAGGNPGAGAIRVIVYYHQATAPTS